MSKGGYEFELVRRLISADPGNALGIGTDDKLFVGIPTNPPERGGKHRPPTDSERGQPASSDDATG